MSGFQIPDGAQQIREDAGLAPLPIIWFGGEFRFLSNFYECSVEYEGVTYPSAEHAFQAAKTTDPDHRQAIQQAMKPKDAKYLGRNLPPSVFRPDWDDVRVRVMEAVVLAKFTQNRTLRAKLEATGERDLIEGNSHGDTFWGVSKGVGENHLGRILVRTRQSFRPAAW